jgi:hypothetical protein
MSIKLRQATAGQEVPLGPFLDSTDGDTEETGLTIANTDILLWKCGATTLVAKNSGGATHISNGIYYAVLDATDTVTAGSLKIFVHMAGALFVTLTCEVLPANVYDSLVAGSDSLTVETDELSSDAKSDIFDEDLTTHTTANTLGNNSELSRKIVTNKRAISGTTETLYDDDGTTPLVQHTLDSATAPTSKTPV